MTKYEREQAERWDFEVDLYLLEPIVQPGEELGRVRGGGVLVLVLMHLCVHVEAAEVAAQKEHQQQHAQREEEAAHLGGDVRGHREEVARFMHEANLAVALHAFGRRVGPRLAQQRAEPADGQHAVRGAHAGQRGAEPVAGLCRTQRGQVAFMHRIEAQLGHHVERRGDPAPGERPLLFGWLELLVRGSRRPENAAEQSDGEDEDAQHEGTQQAADGAAPASGRDHRRPDGEVRCELFLDRPEAPARFSTPNAGSVRSRALGQAARSGTPRPPLQRLGSGATCHQVAGLKGSRSGSGQETAAGCRALGTQRVPSSTATP